MKKLTPKEKKLVKAKVQGKTNVQAYAEAGYSVKGKHVRKDATVKINKPHIQKAIDDALESQGATPEWAVAQMMKVAEQDKEMGAKRLAAMNILELHGWNKSERPTVSLQVENASFFGQARKYVDSENQVDGDEA